MTPLTIENRKALDAAWDNIERTSSDLADACRYVGTTMRGRFLGLYQALQSGDEAGVAENVKALITSDLISSFAGKFRSLRERAYDLWSDLAPWGKVIFGLTVGLAGYFLAAELGLMLSAILMIGGFLYAITNALDVLYRNGIGRAAGGN